MVTPARKVTDDAVLMTVLAAVVFGVVVYVKVRRDSNSPVIGQEVEQEIELVSDYVRLLRYHASPLVSAYGWQLEGHHQPQSLGHIDESDEYQTDYLTGELWLHNKHGLSYTQQVRVSATPFRLTKRSWKSR